MSRVLISGASIAGPATAYWLSRFGWDVVVVERAPAFREGGQNIDVRGAAAEVVRRMGVDEKIRAATTGEQGTEFVGARGQVLASFPAGTTDSGGATGAREILRGDLSRILVDASLAGDRPVEYRYGDRIVALSDQPGIDGVAGGVLVSFAEGPDETFDVVIAADGISSSTRNLVFGDEVEIRSLGFEVTYGTIPGAPSDKPWWRWYNAPRGRNVSLRPDNQGGTRASLSIMTGNRSGAGAERRSPAELRRWLHEEFDDAGWQAERVLAGFDAATDVYSESIGQVHAPRWSTGGVGLVGDAAWCATPVSGMGTSLSLVGAYVLAGELTHADDRTTAFRRYEQIMRPYVTQAQKLPPGTPGIANPQTRLGIAVFNTGVRIAAALPAAFKEKVFAPPADAIELPDYPDRD